MKTFFRLLFIAVLVSSCGEADTKVYNGENINSQTFFSFTSSVYSLPIEVDAEGSVDVKVTSSNVSDVDRTYAVNVVAEETTVDAAIYNLPASVTIPAGSYEGILTITGQDVGLEDPKVLVIQFDFPEEASFDTNKVVVNVNQVCPIEAGLFVGNYLIEEITPFVDGPTLDDGFVVNVKVPSNATNPLQREFVTRNYIDYCTTATMTFKFELVCNKIIVAPNLRSTCACTSSGLFFGPAIVPGVYDAEDDSTFELTFTNDVTGDCSSAAQTTYKFTKQ